MLNVDKKLLSRKKEPCQIGHVLSSNIPCCVCCKKCCAENFDCIAFDAGYGLSNKRVSVSYSYFM